EVGVAVSDVSVNGEPAGQAPGPQVSSGEPVDVQVTVTNTGGVDIEELDASGQLSCEASSLAPGESTSCGAQVMPDAPGQYEVSVSVNATGPEGSTASAEGTAYFEVTNGQPGGDEVGVAVSDVS